MNESFLPMALQNLNRLADGWWSFVWPAAWQAAVVGVLVLAAVRLGRRRPSPLRYALLLVALVKFAMPPLLWAPTGVMSRIEAPPAAPVEQVRFERAPGARGDASAPPDAPSLPAVSGKSAAVSSIPQDASWGSAGRTLKGEVPPGDASESDGSPPAQAPPASVATSAAAALPPGDELAAAPPLPSWKAGLMILHALGALAVFAWVVVQIGRLRRSVLAAPLVTGGKVHERLVDVSRELRLLRTPPLRLGPKVAAPAAVGILRPTVMLPAGALQMPEEELRSVLAHEAAHCRRGDCLVNALQIALSVAWWFHPVFWLTGRALRRVREECCDDLLVARGLVEPDRYCDALLNVARLLSSRRGAGALGALGFAERMHPLAARLRRLTDRTLTPAGGLSLLGLLAVVVAAFVLLPGLRPGPEPFSVSDDPLDLRFVGVRRAESTTLYNERGEPIGERNSWGLESSWEEDKQAVEFLFDAGEFPENARLENIYQIGRPGEQDRGIVGWARGRPIYRDGRWGLALEAKIQDAYEPRFLGLFKRRAPIERVDLTVRYRSGPPEDALFTFDGPFRPGMTREARGGAVTLEIVGGLGRNAQFILNGSASEYFEPNDLELELFDSSGKSLPVSDNGSGSSNSRRSDGKTESTFSWSCHLSDVALVSIGRIAFGRPVREKVFRNIPLPPRGENAPHRAFWLQEVEKRLSRSVDDENLTRDLGEDIDSALAVIDVVSPYVVPHLLLPGGHKDFGEFSSGEQERIRRAARIWSDSEDLGIRIRGLALGLRFNLPGYLERVASVIGKVRKDTGPWGLRPVLDGNQRYGWMMPVGNSVVQNYNFGYHLAYGFEAHPVPLTPEQAPVLAKAIRETSSPDAIRSLTAGMNGIEPESARREALLQLAADDDPAVWLPALDVLRDNPHSPLDPRQAPRDIQVRSLVAGGGPRQDTPPDLAAEARALYPDIIREYARGNERIAVGTLHDLLRGISKHCDPSSVTAPLVEMIETIGENRPGIDIRAPETEVVKTAVKQINLWHDVNLGRLGADPSFLPLQIPLDLQKLARDVAEWRRTGRDPGALPDGYQPRPGDLRVVWRNPEDVEASWVDTWRMPQEPGADSSDHLLWELADLAAPHEGGQAVLYRLRAITGGASGQPSQPMGYEGLLAYTVSETGLESGNSEAISFVAPRAPLRIETERLMDLAQYEIWVEDALSSASILAGTAVFEQWKRNPADGLRFARVRQVEIHFPEDESVGYLDVHPGNKRLDARGVARLRPWDSVRLNIASPPKETGFVDDLQGVARVDLMFERMDVPVSFLERLASLRSLNEIDFQDAAIDDRHLQALAKAASLRSLDLRGVRGITHQGFRALAKRPDLMALSLVSLPLSKEGLEAIAGMKALEHLQIVRAGQFRGEGDEERPFLARLGALRALPDLRNLNVRSVEVPREEWLALRGSQLQQLTLGEVNVDDAVLEIFAGEGYESVGGINLTDCPVTAEGLARLKALPNLRRVSLRETDLTSEDVEALHDALPDCRFSTDIE